MPALQVTSDDATLPGPVRQRVWAAPEVRSHSLALVTFSRLYLAPLTSALPHPEIVADLEEGGDGAGVFRNRGTAIELHSVNRVQLDLLTDTITIDYTTESGPETVTIVLDTPTAADDLFAKLRDRLGGGFTLIPYTPDPWAAVRGPLVVMVGVAAGTAMVAFGLSASAGTVDWRWISGIGGMVFAGLQLWLYDRWANPPAVLELTAFTPTAVAPQ